MLCKSRSVQIPPGKHAPKSRATRMHSPPSKHDLDRVDNIFQERVCPEIFCEKLKNVSCEYDRLIGLKLNFNSAICGDTSDALVVRACSILHL